MKIVAIVQARMGSSRLPGKVLKRINGMTVIEILLSRLSQANLLDSIVVAVPAGSENQDLVDHIYHLGYECVQGSEDDVLNRFHVAAERFEADVIVRITGDCPLVDFKLVDDVITELF